MCDILSLQTTLLKVVESLHTALYQGIPPAKRMCGEHRSHSTHKGHILGQNCVCQDVGTPFSHFHKALLWTSSEPDENDCIQPSNNSERYYGPTLTN